MSYYFAKTLNMDFDGAVKHVTDALKAAGFGIITEINVKDTFKQKIGVDFRQLPHPRRLQSAACS